MGFFDKLFGGKTEQEETVKFFGQSKTVLTPIRGKVLAQADIPDETFAQGILGRGLDAAAGAQDALCERLVGDVGLCQDLAADGSQNGLALAKELGGFFFFGFVAEQLVKKAHDNNPSF